MRCIFHKWSKWRPLKIRDWKDDDLWVTGQRRSCLRCNKNQDRWGI